MSFLSADGHGVPPAFDEEAAVAAGYHSREFITAFLGYLTAKLQIRQQRYLDEGLSSAVPLPPPDQLIALFSEFELMMEQKRKPIEGPKP